MHDLEKPGFSTSHVMVLKKSISKILARCAAGQLAQLTAKGGKTKKGPKRFSKHVSVGTMTWQHLARLWGYEVIVGPNVASKFHKTWKPCACAKTRWASASRSRRNLQVAPEARP